MPGLLIPWYVPMIPDADIVAFKRVRLEPLVEEVGGGHRHQLDEDRLLALGELLEAPEEACRAGGAAAGRWRRGPAGPWTGSA